MTIAVRSKILVVDDQSSSIQTLFQVFKADHDVFMATSGPKALELCSSVQPDLILLDVVMPEMDGHEVCRRLKQSETLRHIPIIFITSLNEPADEAQGLELGAVDFIAKPFNTAVVRARVSTHLHLQSALHQVQNAATTMEMRVQERTAELHRTLERLTLAQADLAKSEARATLSTLIAGVSHEMGTPLGNSLITADTLCDQSEAFAQRSAAGALRRSDLETFVKDVQHGADLIRRNLNRANELLSRFRQVAADQASEQQRVFDLANTVGEVVETIGPSLKRSPHRLIVNIPSGISLHSQPGALGQVLINLINNAYLHAFEPDGPAGQVHIDASATAMGVEIRVGDNGKGMSETVLSQIFDPFFSTKIGAGGTGLGMAIVQDLVQKNLQGRIRAESTPGIGTCFYVTLPLELVGEVDITGAMAGGPANDKTA
jgi:signal transduction histidine kinase